MKNLGPAPVHDRILDRDLTRHDLRELVRRAVSATRGSYQAVVRLFGMPDTAHKRFLSLPGTDGCVVDFREFRTPAPRAESEVEDRVPPEMHPPGGGRSANPP